MLWSLIVAPICHLRNKFNFWSPHGIMNTLGLLLFVVGVVCLFCLDFCRYQVKLSLLFLGMRIATLICKII